MNKDKAILIYLDDCIVISKKIYNDWKEIQKEYGDSYKTSLIFMTCEEIIDFFKDDCKDEKLWPFSSEEITTFFEGN